MKRLIKHIILTVGVVAFALTLSGISLHAQSPEEHTKQEYENRLSQLVDTVAADFEKELNGMKTNNVGKSNIEVWEAVSYALLQRYSQEMDESKIDTLIYWAMKQYAARNDKERAARLHEHALGYLANTCDAFWLYILQKAMFMHQEAFGAGNTDIATRIEYAQERINYARQLAKDPARTEEANTIYKDLVERYSSTDDDNIKYSIVYSLTRLMDDATTKGNTAERDKYAAQAEKISAPIFKQLREQQSAK